MKLKKILISVMSILTLSSCGTNEQSDGHSHTFSENWFHDATYHWHEATCGHDVIDEKLPHAFNMTTIKNSTTLVSEATCSEPAKYYKTCVCGEISTNPKDIYEVGRPLGHTFSTEWTFNETHHWHATTCEHTSEMKDYGIHQFTETNIKSSLTLANEATCSEPARYYKTCLCGAVSTNPEDIYEVGVPKGHTFSDVWTYNETHHWHEATCQHKDEKKDYGSHIFNQTSVRDETTLINNLSCTEPARYYKTCLCGAVSTNPEDTYEVGVPKGHTFSDDWTYDNVHHWHDATCEHKDEKKDYGKHDIGDGYKLTNDGTKHYYECYCGYVSTPEEHTYGDWQYVEPTINHAGEKYRECNVCGHRDGETYSRIYSTVNEVNELINKIKNLSSIEMLDGSLIEETKTAYLNLSVEDKASVVNYNVLEDAYTAWEEKYEMVYDPLLNGSPVIDGHETSIDHDDQYGTILKINVPTTNKTSEFGFNINSNSYGKDSVVHIFIKTPFGVAANTSQTAWVGPHNRDYSISLNPSGWTDICGLGEELSETGENATKLVEKIVLQRYLNNISFEYSGDYCMASIIAEKRVGKEGDVVIPVSVSAVDKINTWGGDESTVSSYNDDTHGNGVELNITAITGAYEIQINGLNKAKAQMFDYVYCYVYAPSSAKFYFSQNAWRNQVMTAGVDPADASAAANSQAAYSAGWNLIKIPVSYLPNKTSICFEIYTPSALGKWIISDFYGGFTSGYISNAATRECGVSNLNSGTGKFVGNFSKGRDDTYGSYDEITITDLSTCSWGPTICLGGDPVTSADKYLRFYVYSPLSFPINMSIYGNGWYSSIFPDGHVWNTCLFPKQWNEIVITTNCYNATDKAYKMFDFSKATIFFEDIKKTSKIDLDGLKISSFELLDECPDNVKEKLTYDINENKVYALGTMNTGNQQMMGFVLVYNKKVIVVDGGERAEYRQLKEILTQLGGHVDYQIFTHAHSDHYGTFLELCKDEDITIDTLVYNFSDWDDLAKYTSAEGIELQKEFKSCLDGFDGNVITCVKGTTIEFDDFRLEFLNNRYEITGDINEASMVFKVTTPNNSIMFLGDLSTNKSALLLDEYKDNLSALEANYVQLAHHGQSGGSQALYQAIKPNYAIWCTTVRNYNNWTVNGINTGILTSYTTREWLKEFNTIDVCPFYETVRIDI